MFEKTKAFAKKHGKNIGRKALIVGGVVVGIAGVYLLTKSGNPIDDNVIILDEDQYEITDANPAED